MAYLLRRVLYGIRTIDGISFGGVSLLFLVIGLLAAIIPSTARYDSLQSIMPCHTAQRGSILELALLDSEWIVDSSV